MFVLFLSPLTRKDALRMLSPMILLPPFSSTPNLEKDGEVLAFPAFDLLPVKQMFPSWTHCSQLFQGTGIVQFVRTGYLLVYLPWSQWCCSSLKQQQKYCLYGVSSDWTSQCIPEDSRALQTHWPSLVLSPVHDSVIPCLRYPLGSGPRNILTSSHPQSPPFCGFFIFPVPQLPCNISPYVEESAWHEVVPQVDALLSVCAWIHLFDSQNLSYVCAPLGHSNALARNCCSKIVRVSKYCKVMLKFCRRKYCGHHSSVLTVFTWLIYNLIRLDWASQGSSWRDQLPWHV